MLLTVTTSVVEYSCLHITNKKSMITIIMALLELNLQLHSDEACLEFHDSIHAPFSAVHLKWSKDCIIQLARSICSRELAGSSLVVALKLRNIKVGCPAHVRCNYNFLILLCSSTKIKCHCGDSDGSILQRLIKCCTRLPAELEEILETPITILCSSTKIERCCPRDILVELHKTLIPKKCFVQFTKRSQ